MHKFLRVFLVLAMLLIVMCGCANIEYHVTVNPNSTIDLKCILAVNSNMQAMLKDSTIADSKATLEVDGFMVSNYVEGNLVGYKAEKHFDSFNDYSAYLASSSGSDLTLPNIEYKRHLFKDEYILNTNINLSLDNIQSGVNNSKVTSIPGVNLNILITLPIPPEEHNASLTSADNKTLTWKLFVGENNKLYLKASFINKTRLLVGVLFGLIALSLLAGYIYISIKQKKEKLGG